MDIYHSVESFIPNEWNHICVNMFDMVTADSQLSKERNVGSSIQIRYITISQPLLVDDIWIGRVQLTGR